MAGRGARGLDSEGQALWRKVTADVTPMHGQGKPSVEPPPPAVFVPLVRRPATMARADRLPAPVDQQPSVRRTSVRPEDTLDGGWDRRLRRGAILPERTIDLHGYTLESAHGALDHAIERALADDVRVLLVITGKPPREDDKRRRGLIRAAIGGWLGSSRHTARIAAVRNAHPRHGGAGALYLIFRRRREMRPGPA